MTNSHTADLFLASSLSGGTAENQDPGFRVRVHATSSQAGMMMVSKT